MLPFSRKVKDRRDATFDRLRLHEIVRHDFNSRAHFRMHHCAWEILQDHPARRGGEAVLEHFDVLAAATANIYEEHIIFVLCYGLEAIEDLLLHGEPIGENGTVLAACCHEGVEVAEGLGIFFDVVPEYEVSVQGVLERCGAGIGGAFVAVFLEIGGHFGKVLEGVVEAGDELSCQRGFEMAVL